MAQLFQRIAQYLANEVITKRLANSRTFQRMAVRTHDNVSKTQDVAKQHSKVVASSLNQTTKQASAVLQEHKSFVAQVKEEVLKELKIKK